MAHILVLSSQISETCRQLVVSLRDQQHEVTLLTSYGESAENLKNIEIMAYFKTWSLLETLTLLPHLIRIRPQIFHVLLDEDEMKVTEMLLAMIARAIPNMVVSTSLLHIKKGLAKHNPVRYLVKHSDIVTCPSLEALHQLRGLEVANIRQGRSILPPTLNLKEHFPQSHSEDDLTDPLSFLENDSFILIPFVEPHFDPESIFFKSLARIAEKYCIVLLGSQQEWSYFERNRFSYWMQKQNLHQRWMLTGTAGLDIPVAVLNKAHAFFIAGVELSPEELTQYYRQILRSSCPLILDSSQSGVHPSLWKHGKNCWIISTFEFGKELDELLNRNNLSVSEKIQEQVFLHKEAVDAPFNELNRLYSRALNNLHGRP